MTKTAKKSKQSKPRNTPARAAPDEKAMVAPQSVTLSRDDNNHAVQDLGIPAMGWMPRDRIMALVRDVDTDLKRRAAAENTNVR